MSVLVVIAVTALVVFYVRASRKARAQWLTKLDLLGCWQWDSGDESLTLVGTPGEGTFARVTGAQTVRGEWRLHGHDLYLVTQAGAQRYDLRLFRPGCIGLKDASGQGRVYEKAGDNVVPLHRVRK